MKTTLGGDRLGSGKKQEISMRNYERSTHDLGYVWRSTMASGTLVPFMKQVGLPGDTFEIKLDVDVLTHPTIAPLFGSYKVQLDVFQVPIRLYNAELHMNRLGIGMDMSSVHLPQIGLEAKNTLSLSEIEKQINPSCILNYLGMRGIGNGFKAKDARTVNRFFNAVPLLMYWDIYKNYYSNKQEEIGAVIHTTARDNKYDPFIVTIDAWLPNTTPQIFTIDEGSDNTAQSILLGNGAKMTITLGPNGEYFNIDEMTIWASISQIGGDIIVPVKPKNMFEYWDWNPAGYWVGTKVKSPDIINITGYTLEDNNFNFNDVEPGIETFPLEHIDQMRLRILRHISGSPFLVHVDATDLKPYNFLSESETVYNPEIRGDESVWSKQYSQEGLGLKTYQSDLFNNWISTEWIDGAGGINDITAVDTSDGSFTIDQLNLSKKIYDMLNRIAISGGTYDDWLDATYTHERIKSPNSPVYQGGLIRELAFQEVISNAQTSDQPLGTLAGRGAMTGKNKGGYVKVKCDEPCYVMGIVSLTPRVDYSQGNDWDVNLLSMNDFHKPALDEIGFQELITDQMAFWDTEADGYTHEFKSAGKQPAWINYMTNVNRTYGNFAQENQQMYMTLNRRYEAETYSDGDISKGLKIKDLTTYIDPAKFNYVFANTRRDAQNFWTQIKCDITARRKMSAKVIPNL